MSSSVDHKKRRPRITVGPDVPQPIRSCIEWLARKKVIATSGLFSEVGNRKKVAECSVALQNGQSDSEAFAGCAPADVCGVLRLVLKGSSLPLNSESAKLLDLAVPASGMLHPGPEHDAGEAIARVNKDILTVLSAVRWQTLYALVGLLTLVHNEPKNAVTFGTLAPTLGSLLFPSVSIKRCAEILYFLADNVSELWPVELMRVVCQQQEGGTSGGLHKCRSATNEEIAKCVGCTYSFFPGRLNNVNLCTSCAEGAE